MSHYICVTCGTQYAESQQPPANCLICTDERQYIGWQGQQWTTLAELQQTHTNEFRAEGDRITGIGSTPKIAIGQRALLLQTSQGNLLWDCITLVDEATVKAVEVLGGIKAIAISHPHYYSCMVEWSQRFGGVPIYLHADDRQWVMRASPEIVFWEGDTRSLFGGITLINCRGHFDGSTVAHWPDAEGGQGALFSGDSIYVAQDRRYVGFMRSFPNYIPLPASAVNYIVDAVSPFPFKRIYGAWWDTIVAEDGNGAVRRSAERYVKWSGG
jgi:hypothetical protein